MSTSSWASVRDLTPKKRIQKESHDLGGEKGGQNGEQEAQRRAGRAEAPGGRRGNWRGGATVKDACRKLAITEHTYYRWRREYGGLKLDQAKRLKQLEKENSRLKRLLAEKELDLSILKEVSEGNF